MINTTTTRCDACNGAGRVAKTFSRWVGGGIEGYRSEFVGDVRCEACYGTGEQHVSEFALSDPHLERAHREGLTIIATEQPGTFMVSSGISKFTYYKATRSTCTCRAGQFGWACKHKSLVRETVEAVNAGVA